MSKKRQLNPLQEALCYLGTFAAMGRICGVSGKAAEKWVRSGRLPRTEATGETNYAELLGKADPRIDIDKLRSTAIRQRSP